MVYCKYKETKNNIVIYTYGATIDDMTGEVSYDFYSNVVSIEKKPEKYGVLKRNIIAILEKNREDFKKGNFKEDIAYEA